MSGLCPFVENFVRNVVEGSSNAGICAGIISVSDVRTGCLLGLKESGRRGDRFKLSIPYAGQHITWEVIFNSCYPEDSPEIILGVEDDEFNPDIECLKNYCSWDPANERSLLFTLKDLLSEYRSHHLSLLSGSRLEFDYNTLFDNSEFDSDDIEVYVPRKNGCSTGPVRFLIRLNVDFSGIPDYLLKDAPGGEAIALLLVNYKNLDGGTVYPHIQLSPRAECLFNMFGGVRLLPFPLEGCLVDYVLGVREQLDRTVLLIINGFVKRKEYTASFSANFGSQMIEFDSIAYKQITCLFEWQDFRFLIYVDLTLKFPQEQPTFTFQSVYHTKADGTPCTRVYTNYPYSPRWGGLEMAARAKAFFLTTIQNFQKESIQEGSSL